MQRFFRITLALGCLLTISGCHCCGLKSCTENYADHVDDIVESSPHLDDWYCEHMDVTRWCMNHRCCR
ncbi:MAG: hypothetical protein KDA96_02665 [Planctomycetaceae bacterium]|nr:hypothetical protein [Planctomycetaceae bacterium]